MNTWSAPAWSQVALEASVCIRRQRHVPAGDVGDGAPCRLRRREYFFRIDGGAPIEVRLDRSTLVEHLAVDRPHSIALFFHDRRLSSVRLRLRPGECLCIGYRDVAAVAIEQNASARACGCAGR